MQESGYNVVYTRTNDSPGFPKDRTENLRKRVQIVNDAKADYFISIHCNGVLDRTAHGTETFVVGKGREAEKLATCVQNEIVSVTGLADRGVKVANYLVLKETAMPAILVELAFISNPNEEKLLRDPAWQDKAARAIANGISTHLGMKEGEDMTSVKVIVKDKEIQGKLIDNRTWVPLREIIEALKNEIIWDEKDRTVTIR